MFRKIFLIALVLPFLAWQSTVVLADEWQEYSYPELGFSIKSPQKLRIEGIKEEGGLVVAEMDQNNLELSVAYLVKDLDELKGKSDKEILDFLIEDLKLTTKIKSQKKIDKFENAIEVLGDVQDEIASLTWIIIEKKGIFQITVSGLDKVVVTEGLGKKFAESFKIIERKGNALH